MYSIDLIGVKEGNKKKNGAETIPEESQNFLELMKESCYTFKRFQKPRTDLVQSKPLYSLVLIATSLKLKLFLND